VHGEAGPGAQEALEERATRIAEKFARGRPIDADDAREAAARGGAAARQAVGAGAAGTDISGSADLCPATVAASAAASADSYAAARKADREPKPDCAAATTEAAWDAGVDARGIDLFDAFNADCEGPRLLHPCRSAITLGSLESSWDTPAGRFFCGGDTMTPESFAQSPTGRETTRLSGNGSRNCFTRLIACGIRAETMDGTTAVQPVEAVRTARRRIARDTGDKLLVWID
jgi:hypothetical protein